MGFLGKLFGKKDEEAAVKYLLICLREARLI